MRCNSFGRTLLFGALAAIGLLAASALPISSATLVSWYLVGSAVAYVAGIAPDLRRGLRAGLVTALLGGLLLILAGSPGQVALGAALLVGFGRSVLVYRSRPARGLAIEALLVGGGLLLARGLLAGPAASLALALWGFFLVQSVFFLIGGVRERAAGDGPGDAFERACARLSKLLEDEGI